MKRIPIKPQWSVSIQRVIDNRERIWVMPLLVVARVDPAASCKPLAREQLSELGDQPQSIAGMLTL